MPLEKNDVQETISSSLFVSFLTHCKLFIMIWCHGLWHGQQAHYILDMLLIYGCENLIELHLMNTCLVFEDIFMKVLKCAVNLNALTYGTAPFQVFECLAKSSCFPMLNMSTVFSFPPQVKNIDLSTLPSLSTFRVCSLDSWFCFKLSASSNR